MEKRIPGYQRSTSIICSHFTEMKSTIQSVIRICSTKNPVIFAPKLEEVEFPFTFEFHNAVYEVIKIVEVD